MAKVNIVAKDNFGLTRSTDVFNEIPSVVSKP